VDFVGDCFGCLNHNLPDVKCLNFALKRSICTSYLN
jgi:hypothetical protein